MSHSHYIVEPHKESIQSCSGIFVLMFIWIECLAVSLDTHQCGKVDLDVNLVKVLMLLVFFSFKGQLKNSSLFIFHKTSTD